MAIFPEWMILLKNGQTLHYLKPLSVTTNVVGLKTDDAGSVGQNSSGHVDRVVDLQTDAVFVTETRFSQNFH